MLRRLWARFLFWFCGPSLPAVVEMLPRPPWQRRWWVRGREDEVPPASLLVKLGDRHPDYPGLTCKGITWERDNTGDRWTITADYHAHHDEPAAVRPLNVERLQPR